MPIYRSTNPTVKPSPTLIEFDWGGLWCFGELIEANWLGYATIIAEQNGLTVIIPLGQWRLRYLPSNVVKPSEDKVLLHTIAAALCGINAADLSPSERKIFNLLRLAGYIHLNHYDDLTLVKES